MKLNNFLLAFSLAGAAAFASEYAPLIAVKAGQRRVLADASGRTVYTFDKDDPNTSLCHDDCEKKWPPVLTNEEETIGKAMSKIKRSNGSLQLAYEGKPVYRYYEDDERGDTYGDGVGGVW